MAMLLAILACGLARGADRFVATTGSDAANACLSSASPCRTIAHAVGQALSGDTVKVGRGSYPEHVAIPPLAALTLSGSWRADFSAQDRIGSRTTIRQPSPPLPFSRPNIDVLATGPGSLDLTVDGFTVTCAAHSPLVGVDYSGGAALTMVLSNSSVRCKASTAVVVRATDAIVDVSLVDTIVERSTFGVEGVAAGTATLHLRLEGSTVRAQRGPLASGVILNAYQTSTAELTLTDCLVTRNNVLARDFMSSETGGVFAFGHDDSAVTVTLDGTTVSRNGSHNNAGGLAVWSEDASSVVLSVVNSAILANRSVNGAGGIDLLSASSVPLSATITASTVSRNSASLAGGGLRVDQGAPTVDLLDTILWGNSAPDGGDLRVQPGAAAVVDADHCDVGQVVIGGGTFNDLGGNIDADPLLMSGGRDPHVAALSPVIDAGTCTGAPADDIDGDPRPTGAGCDIGADESAP